MVFRVGLDWEWLVMFLGWGCWMELVRLYYAFCIVAGTFVCLARSSMRWGHAHGGVCDAFVKFCVSGVGKGVILKKGKIWQILYKGWVCATGETKVLRWLTVSNKFGFSKFFYVVFHGIILYFVSLIKGSTFNKLGFKEISLLKKWINILLISF